MTTDVSEEPQLDREPVELISSHRGLSARQRARRYWHQLRNRLLTNPRFHQTVTRLPLLRRIAQQKATALHDITAGFVYSQVLFACVELDLFTRLASGPRSTQALSQDCGLPETGLQTLLRAAHSLNLVEHYADNEWGLGELGAAMVANPGIGAMVRHHSHLYQDLADPVALLQARVPTALSQYWPYALGQAQGDTRSYSDLMSQSQALVSPHILDAYPFDQHRRMLDIAGGQGNFARAVLARFANLEVTVFDLPEVIQRAEAEHPRLDGLHWCGGDMFTGALPEDMDLITLVRIVHDHDDEPVVNLLRNIRSALAPSGRLVIAEPMAGTPGAEAIGDAYFGLYLWAMGSGRPRTFAEIRALLDQAGFNHCRERRSNMPCLVRVIEAWTEFS